MRGMFCKRHRWFEKLSVLSLGEAGEWMFRAFKNLLYGSFEASFFSVQAYLMSAMITPEFVVFVNDVLCFPFPVTFTMAMCALVLVFLVLVRGMWCKQHVFLGELVNPVLGDAGIWVSRVFKDQVFGAVNLFSLIWLFGLWTAATVCDMLSFFSNYLYVAVLLHFEKTEMTLEGIRQLYAAVEIEEVKLNTFCDLHETPRYGSSGFPVCLPRFGMRVHSRCLGMDAQGNLESWSESNLAKETGVCERTQVDGQFRKVQAGVLVLLLLRLGDLAHVVSLLSVGLGLA